MAEIVRKDGRIYYGERICADADHAYRLFRDEYHSSIGRKAFLRLNRLGQREERMHGYGFVFAEERTAPVHTFGRIPIRLLGLVGISYCWIFGTGEIHTGTDDEFEQWLDWALSRGSGALRTVGRDKSGRTSKRLKARYR